MTQFLTLLDPYSKGAYKLNVKISYKLSGVFTRSMIWPSFKSKMTHIYKEPRNHLDEHSDQLLNVRLLCSQGFNIIWPGNLVLGPTWPIYERIHKFHKVSWWLVGKWGFESVHKVKVDRPWTSSNQNSLTYCIVIKARAIIHV